MDKKTKLPIIQIAIFTLIFFSIYSIINIFRLYPYNFEIKGLEELSYCSRWKLIETEARKVILTDYMEVDIIELPKIRTQKTDKNDKLLEWLSFLINPE